MARLIDDADGGVTLLGGERVLRGGQGDVDGAGSFRDGKDVGVDLKPRVKYDATAGAGIASRREG